MDQLSKRILSLGMVNMATRTSAYMVVKAVIIRSVTQYRATAENTQLFYSGLRA